MNKRRGGFSLFRIALIAGVVGLLLVGAGVFSVYSDQNSRRSPLDIAPYQNAQYWGTSEVKDNSRNVFYRSPDKPEAVAAYYQQKMNEMYGNSDPSCVRLPPTGNTPGSDTDPTIIPFQFICMFDNSGFQSTQYTRVVIYPGQPNSNAFLNAAGMTIIKYEELWQR